MKHVFFLTALLSVMGGSMGHAQNNIYTHVEQNSTSLEDRLGTAAFSLYGYNYTVSFKDGKAVMTTSDNIVASLPMTHGGELVVEHVTEQTTPGYVTKTYNENVPYVTVFSPFQLYVPSNYSGSPINTAEVHVPVYDSEKNVLSINSDTKLADYTVIPVETPIVITGYTADVHLPIASWSGSPFSKEGALKGSSLKIDKPEEGTIYTFGFGKEEAYKDQFGLFRFVGTSLSPGVAYLQTSQSNNEAKYIPISYDDKEATAINSLEDTKHRIGVSKRVENGRVVIIKDGKKFNISGQEVE